MENTAHRAIAIVGVGAVLPDAPNVPAFWENVKNSRYSITEVTPDRWDPAFYYDPDHSAPDKTYSKIGGWVREHVWDPMKWRLPIPPRVVDAMDGAQKWAIACTREALEDYGYPKRPFDPDRTAVILGNAMAGERHYLTSFRVFFPEYAHQLAESASFAALPAASRNNITRELHDRMAQLLPEITEDSMPGELANCIAGRIANVFNFHGPNYVVDAACASAMAAISSAVEGLVANDFDVAITGGIDRNMGPSTFVKFCKIGALSATGTRPYAEGADGFVMGEGTVIFLIKRLADAERDGDKIYAVLRGIAGSSDGKGKGITAPNPIGQKLAIERAWQNAGLSPATASLFEGHGTSTSVGDVVEAQSMLGVLSSFHLPTGSIALGSVKSNFGHLKGAAGAAGLLKLSLALRDKVLPPSVHCEHPNPNIDFAHSPLYVNTELKPWTIPADATRRGGLSAFGFGGTNFHAVLEEYIPGRLNGNGKRSVAVTAPSPAVAEKSVSVSTVTPLSPAAGAYKAPLRGALVIGATEAAALAERLEVVQNDAAAGRAPAPAAPAESDLRALERLVIDYADAADLADKSGKALKALKANQAAIWKALRPQGIFRGHGAAGKVAFLYTGQGSQYVNMLEPLRAAEPIVAKIFAEADRIMTPLLGKPLSEFIFVDQTDADAVAKAEEDLRQTEITQPTVLTIDLALTQLLAAYGIQPDMTMGHSLGEYGALVASGSLTFEDALGAVSARGRGMTHVAVNDTGKMAAVFAPLAEVERILKTINDYVVIANINSGQQSVIGGASKAVEQAMEIFLQAGYDVRPLPVSHAFHTSIVAPASGPLREMLSNLHIQPPRVPVVANVNGEFYPTGPDVVPQMLDLLAQQVASPVQFVKGLRTLYDAGARMFVEVGPKKALQGFAEEVLGDRGDVVSLFTNHPKVGDIPAFNQALCALYAAGLGRGQGEVALEIPAKPAPSQSAIAAPANDAEPTPLAATAPAAFTAPSGPSDGNSYDEIGRLFADALQRGGWQLHHGERPASTYAPVAITGASLGLPGTERIFDDGNIERILRGDQFIAAIPARLRQDMLDKHILRLVKSEKGEATFEYINDVADVIKLAGRGGAFDLESEFGVSAERLAALDQVTRLAIGAGIDALRDAGIPLVMRYKTTSKGTQLPDRWGLPDAMRDDTGVIFGSAFPGLDAFADEMARYYADHARHEQLEMLESLRARATGNGHSDELDQRIAGLRVSIEKEPYVFDRRFLLKTLSMGHSQFAELIGARGPNTQINAACASTAQAVGLAEDWIGAGRCRRVVIISADDVTSDHLIGWVGAGFLASGAAATDEVVEDAAIPFDRRRHGMIMGMGAAALVVESLDAARERGIRPICEVLSAVMANSAFHGTRLDVQHIGQVMEGLVAQAEARGGVARGEVAPKMVFVSHETYTPARGGSASAEIHALRRVFGEGADQIVIANTKGLTGHAMGTGIEDVVAVKTLETGLVPPVVNFKEVDPELGPLNLSKGGAYPIQYALHLGAGFGSQISMILLRWVPTKDGIHPSLNALGYAYRIADKTAWSAWLSRMAGRPVADLEVVNRTLRVRDQGLAARITDAAKDVRPVPAATATVPAPVAPTPVVHAKPAPTAPAPAPVAPTPVVHTKPAPTAPAIKVAEPSVKVESQSSVKVQVATPTPSAPAQPTAQGDSVKERILTLMVEKTGYPKDMLDVDLDLEADLGVDTVKQAEMFAAIREIYNIPRDENRKLRDYPTLAHVIRFVYEKRPDLARTAPPSPTLGEASAPATTPVATQPITRVTLAASPTNDAGDSVKERILTLMVEKTGYPKDMLDVDLDLEADLGVDTVKQAEMFAAIREIYNIPRDENRKLRDYPTLAHVIRFVYEKRPDLAQTAPPSPAMGEPSAPTTTPVATQPITPVTAVASPTNDAGESVKERILTLMVEKTGYPKDMLDLELDLEADLGVDTVKQAEMFAAIREIYNIPRDENRKLRDYPTLAHVIRFVYEKRPDLAGVTPSSVTTEAKEEIKPTTPAPAVTSVQELAGDSVKERILTLMVEKTGYPRDMLDLDLDLEADLGVDTVKQAEMFAAIREIYNIPRDENRKLRDYPTLAHVIRFVYEKRPDLAQTAPPSPTMGEPSAPATTPVATQPITPVTAVASPTNDAGESVKERILTLMVEKTGYPKDMLDLELDLEADLGVDTVKQAEMFAAIREIYNIPRDENRKLRDYPTLAHVIRFVYEKRPDLAGVPPSSVTTEAKEEIKLATPVPAVTSVQDLAGDSVKERILTLMVEKTGYPRDMLDLDLDLEADLGVDTVKQAEMFAAIREIYDIPRDENRKLRDYPTLAHVIRFVYEKRPDLAQTAPPSPTMGEASAPATTPVATQPTTPVTAVASPTNDAGDPVKDRILTLMVEKTGYPKDMLDVDLDMEADLGVDTVKQAEMFAAIREIYNIPRDENRKLRDYPTLAHVIRFVYEKRPDLASAPLSSPTTATQSAPSASVVVTPARPPVASFDAANHIPRRVPVPNLRPPLNLCKPTGVKFGAGCRVVVMPDQGGVADALAQTLQTKGVAVLQIQDARDPDALVNALKSWLAAGPVQGVYWLPALDYEGPISKMDLPKWHEALQVRAKSLYTTMRILYEQIAAPGTFLVAATRLGGQHGYDQAGALAPLGGAVVGFTKTYKRERAESLVKAVDFEPECKTADIAELLIEETLRDPGAVEIGYKRGLRWSVGVQEQSAVDGKPGLTLDQDTVFLITGAAGSIVSAITADLAAASGGTFYLLDLVPEPDPNNPDLKRFVNDKEGLKRDLFARIQARGERATPALVEKELASLERAQAAQSAIDAVRAAGGTAHYFSVNLTDPDSVAGVINKVRERSGRIDVLLHAAGIERSHFLPDKDPREFDLVFDVKSDGWFNLLHAIGDMPLGATVAFSSVAGRFGNAGQADYSSANDLLCKITSSFRTTRPQTRGIVIDWTAWGGIGMATRGSIPKMMELAGIDMLPPEAGIPLIRRELTSGKTCGEIVVGQRLGVMLSEWDVSGGLDLQAFEASSDVLPAPGPMVGKITGMGLYHGLTMETTLDPAVQPFLHDHRIDGTPVLPGVMGIEAFAEAAVCVHFGWHVEAVEEVNFLAPFKFYRNEPRTVIIQAVYYPQGDRLVADCRLIGRRTLPNQSEPHETTHFTARVRLTKQLPKAERAHTLGIPAGSVVEAAAIYRAYFHGPAYQVVERAWWDGNRIIGEMAKNLPSNHHPAELPMLAAPRLIELCFQTAGLWEMGVKGRMGLPQHIDEVRIWRTTEQVEGRLFAVVTPNPDQGSFDAEVLDTTGNRYVHLRGYRTATLPNAVDADPLKTLEAVMAPQAAVA